MRQDKSTPHYASTNHPTIEAVLQELFRFDNEQSAEERIQAIRDTYTISKNQIENPTRESVVLWIHGYEVTEKEKKKGYLGNYAAITFKRMPDMANKYTLYAMKMEVALKFHPRRKRMKHKHPNWGHPVLRNAKRKKIFKDVEEARADLMRLHEEYPDVSIPLTNKMYIIVFTREENPPVQKYVLEIKVNDKGGYYLDCVKNDYKPKVPENLTKKAKEKSAEEIEKETPGYFASMVAMKRKGGRPSSNSDSNKS